MKKPSLKLIALALILLINSCAGINAKKYADQTPKFDIKNYFNGDIESWGVIKNSNGIVVRKFTAKISGKWDGNKGIIQQNFVFDDGEKDSRTWMMSVENENKFSAIAHDIIGSAKGEQFGNAMEMQYVLTILEKDKKANINVKDYFYLVDEKNAISISELGGFASSKGTAIAGFKKISSKNSDKTELKSSESKPLEEIKN